MESLNKIVLDENIESVKKAATKPCFHSLHNRPGWMALMCADNTTMQRLESTIKDITPWERAELREDEEAEIPHNEILVVYPPGRQRFSTPKIL
ncbi:hypothetical protein JTB14_021566 [Gonioctena quinquepunctata]|nr:hypothetical protein JTB14_021566 [Gonioctena quinquepunctata]